MRRILKILAPSRCPPYCLLVFAEEIKYHYQGKPIPHRKHPSNFVT